MKEVGDVGPQACQPALACHRKQHNRAIPLKVFGGLALARLAGEVSSETVASSLTHGRLFRLGDLCPSAPVELTSLVNHPLAAVASCLLSWFPPCRHDSFSIV